MAFIRIKQRTDKKGRSSAYAYLVENKWLKSKRQPKQRVKEYLGRVCRPRKEPLGFSEFKGIHDVAEYSQMPYQDMIRDLIQWELHQHGVSDVQLNLERLEVRKNDRRVAVAMNDGFLCDHTLRGLLSVATRREEETPGYLLAKALVDAGLDVPKELFVKLYEKTNGLNLR